MKLRALSADDVIAEWDWLRAGLLQVIAKTESNYRPEDVYLRARTGAAWIFAIDDCGFVVLEQEHDCDGLVVVVWVLWCEPGAARAQDGSIYAELERIGREAKAKRIRMMSPRKGWERERFWRQVAVIYEREL